MAIIKVKSMAEMLKRFESLGKDLEPSIFNAMVISAEAMFAEVTTNKMRGQYLGVVTGRGIRSMVPTTTRSKAKISAGIGSSVGYIAAHEQGFKPLETVGVKAHEARHRGRITRRGRRGVNANAILRRARLTKAQKATGVWAVKGHRRKVDIPARHFMRDTVREEFIPTVDRIERALYIAALTGGVASRAAINAGR
jgi:hypothetical protein